MPCCGTCQARCATCCPGLCFTGGKFADEVITVKSARLKQIWTDDVDSKIKENIVRIQALVRGFMVRWKMKRIKQHSNMMSRRAFNYYVAFLLIGKTELMVCMLAALGDYFTTWDTPPTTPTAEYLTPFQKHPHNYGAIFQFMVTGHIISGSGLLCTMLFPILSRKGGSVHLWGGRVFLFFWVLHMINGLVNASVVIATRGYHEENYPDRSEGFSMWLYIQFGFIANAVADFLIHGLANLQFKTVISTRMRLILKMSSIVTMGHAAVYIFLGAVVLGMGGYSADAEEYSIIFIVEVPPYLYLLWKNYKHWNDDDLDTHLNKWMTEHSRNMYFCANLTLITGLANLTFRVAPWATVSLWASQEIVVIFWVWLQNRAQKRRLQLAYRHKQWAAVHSNELLEIAAERLERMPAGGAATKGPPARPKQAFASDMDVMDV